MKISVFPAPRISSAGAFRCVVGALALSFLVARAAPGQSSDSDTVTAQLQAVTPHISAYAQVEPINVLPVNAAETGVVEGLKVLPGMHVSAHQALAHLRGPDIQNMLSQSEANIRSAKSELLAAQKTLAIDRQQLPAHLTTRQAVHQAEASEAQAQTALDNAQSHLQSVRQMMTILAPASGVVTALDTMNGQLVSTGQPILTLQLSNGLWLRASYYGPGLKQIRVGMTGLFTPDDGSAAVPVRVASIPGTLMAGGGESIALVPVHATAAWLSGEAGTVTLNLPKKKLLAVPTRALVLNQGKWWVMVHTAKGDRPQQVVPGTAQGWDTFIESGLSPGSKVIVNNAYLLFHASIAEQYQIPD